MKDIAEIINKLERNLCIAVSFCVAFLILLCATLFGLDDQQKTIKQYEQEYIIMLDNYKRCSKDHVKTMNEFNAFIKQATKDLEDSNQQLIKELKK